MWTHRKGNLTIAKQKKGPLKEKKERADIKENPMVREVANKLDTQKTNAYPKLLLSKKFQGHGDSTELRSRSTIKSRKYSKKEVAEDPN